MNFTAADSFEIYLIGILAFSLLILIILKIKNRNTAKSIEDLGRQIKPFEIKIDRDAEKMKPADIIEEGDVLSRDIRDENNLTLFHKNMVITAEVKSRIIESQIGFVWVKMKKFKGF